MRIQIHLMAAGIAMLFLAMQTASAQDAETFEPDEAAAKALNEVAQACRNRPALRVKSRLKIELTQGETTAEGKELEAEFLHVKGGDGLLKIRGFTCYVNGDKFYAIHKDVDHSYFSEPLDGAPYWLFFDAFRDLPYPHLAFFWGDTEPEFLWWELHSGTPEIVPVAVEDVEVADDEDKQVRGKRRQITLKGPNGSMVIRFDPKTKLVDYIEHRITGGELLQPGAIQTTRYRIQHTVFDKPPDPKEYVFTPDGRQRVDLLATLMPRPDPAAAPDPGVAAVAGETTLIGKPAPMFTLATADDDAVDLEELRGQVVVLDFWATWCGPCRQALPSLHEVARWADGRDLPVRILTINVWEGATGGEAGPEEKVAAVREFWRANKFTLPVAMDYTDETAAAYGVTGIPTTVIIRSDGIVHTTHTGAAGVDQLKQDITDALEALEAGDAESDIRERERPPAG